MKLPNGFGSVYKLPGKRRKPWQPVKQPDGKSTPKPIRQNKSKKLLDTLAPEKKLWKLLPDITKIPTIYLPKNPLLVMCTKHGLMYISLPWVVLPVSVLLLLHISTVLHYTISK